MEMHTPRLRLDALRPADAEALFGYRGDPDVARFQGWRPASVAEAANFIERQAASLDTPGSWFQRATRLREGTLIGDVGIHLPADAEGSVEFGVSMAPAHQGRGYACEAMRAVFELVFGQLGRHRIHASVDPLPAWRCCVRWACGRRLIIAKACGCTANGSTTWCSRCWPASGVPRNRPADANMRRRAKL